jgi:hypothetical protein
MSDTHDERGEGADAAALRDIADLLSDENLDAHRISASIAAAIREMREQLAAATARAESAMVLHGRWKALIAERDAAVKQAREAEALTYRIIGAIEHAYALNTYVELEPGETAPTVESLWAEVREIRGVDDGSGWTAAENAEFEQRYGVKAAMRLRAATDRVWRVVRELRQAAVNAGRDPYQDPMARRLSAALVGAENNKQEPDRCSCGCLKIGDGCDCRFCNEPYPTRQSDDDTTEIDR